MRLATTALCATAAIFACGSASAVEPAGPFGHQGQIIISAERLFGLDYTSAAYRIPNGNGNFQEGSVSGTQFSLLVANSPLGGVPNPYTTPRIAFDYVVIPNLTLGGSVGYSTASGQTQPDGGKKQDLSDYHLFEFSPRVGYIIGLGDIVSFWPRGGLTYYSAKADYADGNQSSNGLGLVLEAAFTFNVVHHFGILASPSVDIPLTGSIDNPNGPDLGFKVLNVGANVGVYTYF